MDPRFVSLFNVYCKAFPADDVVDHIFHSILSGHMRDFNDDVKTIVPSIIKMTLMLYKVNSTIAIVPNRQTHGHIIPFRIFR